MSDFEKTTGIDVIKEYFEHLTDESTSIKYSRVAYNNMRKKFGIRVDVAHYFVKLASLRYRCSKGIGTV